MTRKKMTRKQQVFLEKLLLALAAGLLLLFVLLKVLIPDNKGRTVGVTDEVYQYQSLVEKACRENKIEKFSNLVLAIMMQESAGKVSDVMQSSESGYNTEYERYPNAITDPEYSIEVGVKTFAACLQAAKCKNFKDMEKVYLALQGYNYGEGYITWALENYGGYSEENAAEFAQMMAAQLGWTAYGDENYPAHVMQYFEYS